MNYEEALRLDDIVAHDNKMLIYRDFCEPTRGTKYSAGIDLRAADDFEILPGYGAVIPLGVWWNRKKINKDNSPIETYSLEIYGGLYLRSSLGKWLVIPNGKGIIDIDYPGEFMLTLHNPYTNIVKIKKGERVAQLVLEQHFSYMLGFETNKIRNGGFGSTGK